MGGRGSPEAGVLVRPELQECRGSEEGQRGQSRGQTGPGEPRAETGRSLGWPGGWKGR